MRTLTLAAVTLFALAGCVSSGTFQKKQAEADALRQEVQAQQSRGADLAAQLDQAKERNRANETSLAQKESELRASQARTAELLKAVDELSTTKKKLEQAKVEAEKKSTEYEDLAGALRGEIDAGRVELSELRGRMTVKMKDRILFASGSATIGRDGKLALEAVADALRGVKGKTIRVEGHTDDVPTGGGAFPTNWELSTARALAVVRFLQETGLDPTRLAAAGYGEYQPVAPNDTPEGRSLNRRIEIVLAPADVNSPASEAAEAADAKGTAGKAPKAGKSGKL